MPLRVFSVLLLALACCIWVLHVGTTHIFFPWSMASVSLASSCCERTWVGLRSASPEKSKCFVLRTQCWLPTAGGSCRMRHSMLWLEMLFLLSFQRRANAELHRPA